MRKIGSSDVPRNDIGVGAIRSTSLIVLLLFVCGQFAGGKGVDFQVDWSLFRGAGDSSRVEFFYAIPIFTEHGVQFEFEARDSGLVAEFSVRFEMEGEEGFQKDATIYKRVSAGSTLVDEAQAKRAIVDGFSLQVPPGKYRFRMAVAKPVLAGDTGCFAEAGSIEDSLDVPDFSQGLAMSLLQLAAGVAFDTVTGGFSVVPNPMRCYGSAGLGTVYFYFEGYNLEPEADSFEVSAALLSRSSEPETLVSAEPSARSKSGSEVSATLGMSVAGLEPGEYLLGVEILDRGRNETVGRHAVFRVAGEEEPAQVTPYRLEMSELERRHHDRLEYVATRNELDYYNALSDSGREAYLAWFWSRHNLAEFARRMETAEARFKTARTSGVKTDRGRIYVKYGEPDEVEHRVLEVHTRPREYWHYYNLGYVFVFIDLRGDSNFRLAYTDSPDEPRTGLERYLTPEEEEMFH